LRRVGKIQADALGGIRLPPVVGYGATAHTLTEHCEVEDAAARAVDMIEFQTGFIEPHL